MQINSTTNQNFGSIIIPGKWLKQAINLRKTNRDTRIGWMVAHNAKDAVFLRVSEQGDVFARTKAGKMIPIKSQKDTLGNIQSALEILAYEHKGVC